MATEGGPKAVLAALVANTGLAIATVVGFLLAGAASMLAEPVRPLAGAGHLGPEELLVGAKLDEALTFSEVAAAIDHAETRLRAAVVVAGIVYREPDVARVEA